MGRKVKGGSGSGGKANVVAWVGRRAGNGRTKERACKVKSAGAWEVVVGGGSSKVGKVRVA